MESAIVFIMIAKLVLTVLSVSNSLTLGLTYSDFKGSDALNTEPIMGFFAAGGFEYYEEKRPEWGMKGEFAYNKRGAKQNEVFLSSLQGYNAANKTYKPPYNGLGIGITYENVGELDIDALQIGMFIKYRRLPESSLLMPVFSCGVTWSGGPREGGVIVKNNNPSYVLTSQNGYTVFNFGDMNYSWWDFVVSGGVDFVTHEEITNENQTVSVVKRWIGLEFRFLYGLNSISEPSALIGEKNIKNTGFSISLVIY